MKWFKRRAYLHFDAEISEGRAAEIVTSPQAVANQPFFPFLQFCLETPHYDRESKRVHVKKRPISYAAHVDAHIFAFYAAQLAELYERWLRRNAIADCVLAYRSLGKSNVHFAREAFQAIADTAPCLALAFDIASFFDEIDHDKLKTAWCAVLQVDRLPDDHFQLWKAVTRYAFVDRDTVFKRFGVTSPLPQPARLRICSPRDFRAIVRKEGLIQVNSKGKGIPQGAPISAVLSNMYLMPFDVKMKAMADSIGAVYRRYCDDILVIAPPARAAEVEGTLRDSLDERALALKESKTDRVEFAVRHDGTVRASKPLQYLGFLFDGARTLIRSQTLARFYRRMKASVYVKGKSAKWHAGVNGCPPRIRRRALYEGFSHLGRWNFLTYARRAGAAMHSSSVRRQLRRHWPRLHDEIQKQEDKLKTTSS